MEGTRTPLSTWFWAAYLVMSQTPGMSALQFQRQLGIKRYETAFQILHKLRAGMFRPEREPIGGIHVVEVDEALVGGRTRGEGAGVHHKAIVIGAVEVRTVSAFVKENVEQGSTVKTDGLRSYWSLPHMGFTHQQESLINDPAKAEAHLPMIHLVFSNLKTWLDGTHHGVSQQHLQAYLNEFVFRFNRRFYPMTTMHSLLGIVFPGARKSLTLARRYHVCVPLPIFSQLPSARHIVLHKVITSLLGRSFSPSTRPSTIHYPPKFRTHRKIPNTPYQQEV